MVYCRFHKNLLPSRLSFVLQGSPYREMRTTLLKLSKGHSTKAERVFAELLKRNRIPFRSKVLIAGREVDFLIGKYAIELNGHEQDPAKNSLLLERGYIPYHLNNETVEGDRAGTEKLIKSLWPESKTRA